MSIFNKNKKKKHRTADSYKGKLLCNDTPFAVSEAYNTLRTNLMYTCVNEKCPVFGIVSALSESGKSLTSANLAIAFSRMNKKVLLIDADMRKPVQHKCFDLQTNIGLSEVLSGQTKFEDVIVHPQKYPALSLLPSGKIPPNPQELLASAKTAEFFKWAKERYDVIIVDLPPIGVVSDATILSSVISGYLMVILQDVTEVAHAKHSYETLERMNCKVIGSILNGVDMKTSRYYKGHGSGSYYRSYYDYKEE